MQKILSAEQIRKADQFTIQNEPIASIDLMERASLAFVHEFERLVHKGQHILVLCGTGNNGGDGLAITRLLLAKGYEVKAVLIRFSRQLSQDCQINLERLNGVVEEVSPVDFQLPQSEVIIDALLGSGLNRPVSGDLDKVIEDINSSQSQVMSVDIPSGLFADEVNLDGAIVQADVTITFQLPKLSFLIPETGKLVGKWLSVDIGLNQGYINNREGDFYILDSSVKSNLQPRRKFEHKGNFGRVQVVAGGLGKMGAAFLCSKAVLRSGAGLLTVHVPVCGMQVMQTSLPEAMLTIDKESYVISTAKILQNTEVVCFGPGVGTGRITAENFRAILESGVRKLVVDADGLNILAENPEMMDLLPEGAILTPHVVEFHRLFGECKNGLERLRVAQNVAFKRNLFIVLKGAHTAVVCPNQKVYFNNTGNPGMATAGSGDVLAGIITGLLAQGLASVEAATMGVFVHGEAGDLAEKTFGQTSLMASDLLQYLPEAISNA